MFDAMAGANAAFKDFAASVASDPKMLSPVAHSEYQQVKLGIHHEKRHVPTNSARFITKLKDM